MMVMAQGHVVMMIPVVIAIVVGVMMIKIRHHIGKQHVLMRVVAGNQMLDSGDIAGNGGLAEHQH